MAVCERRGSPRDRECDRFGSVSADRTPICLSLSGADTRLGTWTSDVHVHGLDNLKVTATIFNTGDETLKLLNDPRGVLDSFPENSFSITDATGSRPEFDGAKVCKSVVWLCIATAAGL